MNESRRGLLAAIGGFLGLTATVGLAKAVPTEGGKVGILTHHLDVGLLPPFKAQALCERIKVEWRKAECLRNYDIAVIPVRPGNNFAGQITVFNLETGDSFSNDFTTDDLEQITPVNNPEFTAPDKQRSIDYVLLMLGSPITKVELDEEQIDKIYEDTLSFFESMSKAKKLGSIDGAIERAFKDIMFGKAQIMLGNVRRNAWTSDMGVFDGGALIVEGTELIASWYDRIL